MTVRSKYVFSVLIPIAVLVTAATSAQDYLKDHKFLSMEDVKKRWGERTFSAEKFKAGDARTRAAMAYDLMKKRTLLGKSSVEILRLLGPASGYFWSDRVPAYFIEEGWRTNQDSWQIVFLLDGHQNISDVRVNKNCCGK